MSNYSIKPIETSYRGYRFRSRTEARWAIWFDELNIKWDYEIEGFELPDGKRYLPDFWLPEMDVFVEIKPSSPLSFNDFMKLIQFGELKNLIIIFGVPCDFLKGENRMILMQKDNSFSLEQLNDLLAIGESEENAVEEILGHIEDFGAIRFSICPLRNEWTIIKRQIDPRDFSALSDAFKKARSARFEFGERK